MLLIRLVVYIILCGFFKKNKRIRLYYLRHLRQLNHQYHIRLEISNISIKTKGLAIQSINLQIKGLSIIINQCYFGLNLSNFFRYGLLNSIVSEVHGVSIKRRNPVSNLHNSFNEKRTSINWDKRFFYHFKKFSHYLFSYQIKLNIFDLNIDLTSISLVLEKLNLLNGHFSFDFSTQKNGQTLVAYHGHGNIDKKEQKLALKLAKKNTSSNHIKILFDELEFNLHQKQLDTEIRTEFEVNFMNLQIFDQRIYPEVLKIDNLYLYFDLEASADRFLIKEESGGSIGEAPFAFNLLHQHCRNDILKFNFSIEVSQKLLESFPTFHNMELGQMRVDGKLILDLQFLFNITDPFQSYFSISFIDNSLSIIDLGNFDLSFLNEDLQNIIACPLTIENLSPRKLASEVLTDQISEDFLKVIVATEDASFYSHDGVNLDSIGYALVSNIAKKTFSRGASTITMQLTRNLFLNSDKNVIRKIEEIIISFMIENHCKISKLRILEIYINVIEFGNGIYGIAQASNYYFGKNPKDLSLTESIVLSYMVPRPKHFHDALLIKTPQLLENLPRYFRKIAGYLLSKKLISDKAFQTLDTEVTFANELGAILLQPKYDR